MQASLACELRGGAEKLEHQCMNPVENVDSEPSVNFLQNHFCALINATFVAGGLSYNITPVTRPESSPRKELVQFVS